METFLVILFSFLLIVWVAEKVLGKPEAEKETGNKEDISDGNTNDLKVKEPREMRILANKDKKPVKKHKNRKKRKHRK